MSASDQMKALMAWIDARIDEKIGEALGRDTLHESFREMALRDDLIRAFHGDDDATSYNPSCPS